jgi:hypothetical protein
MKTEGARGLFALREKNRAFDRETAQIALRDVAAGVFGRVRASAAGYSGAAETSA